MTDNLQSTLSSDRSYRAINNSQQIKTIAVKLLLERLMHTQTKDSLHQVKDPDLPTFSSVTPRSSNSRLRQSKPINYKILSRLRILCFLGI